MSMQHDLPGCIMHSSVEAPNLAPYCPTRQVLHYQAESIRDGAGATASERATTSAQHHTAQLQAALASSSSCSSGGAGGAQGVEQGSKSDPGGVPSADMGAR